MSKEIFVSIDLAGQTYFVGRLWCRTRGNRESASFEYAKSWLESPLAFELQPGLVLFEGAQHTPANKIIFGAFGDSAPDRWGRVLMRRAERVLASEQQRTPQQLLEADYLLRVSDESRQGALRFSLVKDGPFLANDKNAIPPLVDLPKLLAVTERFTQEKETAEELLLLLAPGSSLGGARPKASVRDRDGALAIAKFPHKQDEQPTMLWEAVALTLAEQAGIVVPEWRLETIAGKAVLISKRFDRDGQQRIPYLSAMSMLGAVDNESRSYLEIADIIRRYSANAVQDLKQLWRRIVFSVAISNLDDHLRNHGFLYGEKKGWSLSPAFDLNPVPAEVKAPFLSTAIDLHDNTASFELALNVAEYFRLEQAEAKVLLAEVKKAVAAWRQVAKRFGLRNADMEKMASAFKV